MAVPPSLSGNKHFPTEASELVHPSKTRRIDQKDCSKSYDYKDGTSVIKAAHQALTILANAGMMRKQTELMKKYISAINVCDLSIDTRKCLEVTSQVFDSLSTISTPKVRAFLTHQSRDFATLTQYAPQFAQCYRDDFLDTLERLATCNSNNISGTMKALRPFCKFANREEWLLLHNLYQFLKPLIEIRQDPRIQECLKILASRWYDELTKSIDVCLNDSLKQHYENLLSLTTPAKRLKERLSEWSRNLAAGLPEIREFLKTTRADGYFFYEPNVFEPDSLQLLERIGEMDPGIFSCDKEDFQKLIEGLWLRAKHVLPALQPHSGILRSYTLYRELSAGKRLLEKLRSASPLLAKVTKLSFADNQTLTLDPEGTETMAALSLPFTKMLQSRSIQIPFEKTLFFRFFLYLTGQEPIPISNLCDTLRIADYFAMDHVTSDCLRQFYISGDQTSRLEHLGALDQAMQQSMLSTATLAKWKQKRDSIFSDLFCKSLKSKTKKREEKLSRFVQCWQQMQSDHSKWPRKLTIVAFDDLDHIEPFREVLMGVEEVQKKGTVPFNLKEFLKHLPNLKILRVKDSLKFSLLSLYCPRIERITCSKMDQEDLQNIVLPAVNHLKFRERHNFLPYYHQVFPNLKTLTFPGFAHHSKFTVDLPEKTITISCEQEEMQTLLLPQNQPQLIAVLKTFPFLGTLAFQVGREKPIRFAIIKQGDEDLVLLPTEHG